MKQKLFKVFNFIIFLSLAVVLLYFAFQGINFRLLFEQLKNAEYSWVFAGFIFGTLGYISRAYRWKILIEPLGYSPSVKNSFYALMTGYLANFALPRLGEITRCATLSKKEKIPVDVLLGTVIAERVVDLLTLIILLVVVFFVKIHFFGKFFTDKIFVPVFGKFSSSLNISIFYYILFAVFIVGLVVLYFVFRSKISEIFIVRKSRKIIRGIYSGILTVFHLKKIWWFLFHNMMTWFMFMMVTYVLFYAIPSTSNLTIIDSLFLLVVGGIGMSVPVQNGFGAFHGLISLALTLYNIPREFGLVYATISHESQAILIFLLSGYSMLMLFLSRKKLKNVNA